MSERYVYLDYAATTPVDARVLDAMTPFHSEEFANPNSLHTPGRSAFSAMERARTALAETLGAGEPSEIVFTGCGTEADNAAIRGIAGSSEKRHVIVSAYEHHAVLDPAQSLRKVGFEVTLLPVGTDGTVHPEVLAEHVRKDTAFVSIMHVNNELGTVNPIADLAAVAHEAGALFHTDASQSLGKTAVDLGASGVDAATLSAHKVYGPKGVGALYLRKGTPFSPILLGGGQESRRRSGTQNVAGIVGFATAARIAVDQLPDESERLESLRDRLISGVRETVSGVTFNCVDSPHVPGIVSMLIDGVEGESVLLHLDAEGFAVSTGSACSSASLEPSHVLAAIGVPKERAHGSLRVSMGRFTTEEDIEGFLAALPGVVERLRAMSPVGR
ncbi:MAG: cysteine desulfurase NifS [Coriobacteriia bacterium]